MKTLIVSSTRPYSGKSGICLVLQAMLASRGARVGYFKPYGTMPVTIDGVLTDQDAAFIRSHSTATVPLEAVCPIVESRIMVEEVLTGRAESMLPKVRSAFSRASQDAEFMIVEGPSDISQGSALGVNLCSLAELLDGRVLLVDRPTQVDLPDAILWSLDCLGEALGGVVFNAVPESILGFFENEISSYLCKRDVRVYGAIPHDPLLSSVTVAEIVEALQGTVLAAEQHVNVPVESFMVGAMGQDKALRFFRRKARKAVITGGDRSDVQLAALETDTNCIVLTGNLSPSSLVLARAEEIGVPMVLVGMDTLTAVEKMEGLLGRVRLHDPAKADRMREMFMASVDTQGLLADQFGVA